MAMTPTQERLRRRRRWRLLAAGAVTLIGVGIAWLATPSTATDDRLLVVDGRGVLSLLDPTSGTTVFSLAGAVATPDRSALLRTTTRGNRTVLESRDPTTGSVTGSTSLQGPSLTVRTISPNGGAVALLPGTRGDGLYEPEPRERTNITVSYTDERPSRTYDLRGNFEPEMFSTDETTLFVIEFVPPAEPTGYLVRMLDLATGEVTDTGAPQVDLNPKMRGKARAQVLHPDGTHLYTLYTLPRDAAPVQDPTADGDAPRRAFIHVIHLEEKWSYCIFLPEPIGTSSEASVGMAISPDGDTVYVVDPSTSTVAHVDGEDLTVTDVVRVEKLRDEPSKAAVAVADDGTVYVGTGHRLLELAPGSLEPVKAWAQELPISGVALSASGHELRVGGGGAVTLIDRSSREETGVLRAPGGGTLSLLGPPRGSVTEFPLECAC